MKDGLILGTSVTWPKAVFPKIIIYEKKPMATFAALSWKPVSGTLNYIQVPLGDWLEVVAIWAPFERRKIEVQTFESANLSGFGTWNFTPKEDLIRRKQVFLLDLRPWYTQKPKICVYYLWEIVQRRKFCSVKARGFWFKNWYFPSSTCCS